MINATSGMTDFKLFRRTKADVIGVDLGGVE
jgi:hypothetical protein